MKGGSPHGGYTVVETLIFLAVTAALFIAIFPVVNGQQHKTEFHQAVKDVESRLQDTMNDVTTGYYPQIGSNYTCTVNGSGKLVFAANGGAAGKGQGTNGDCIFVGKVMQFGVGPPASIDKSKVNIYTVAGRRLDGDRQVSDIAAANPEPVVLNGSQSTLDITETVELQYGLTFYASKTLGTPPPPVQTNTNYTSVGVFTSFGQSTMAGQLKSGSRVASLAYISNPAKDVSKVLDDIRDMRTTGNASLQDARGGVRLCFLSGGTDEVAVIDVGGAELSSGATSRQLTVETNYFDKSEAAAKCL
jgi:hypothetical protein